MKEETRRLIKAVAENRLSDAKKICRAIVEKDTTQKEQRFCEEIINILNTQGNMIELPYTVKGLLYAEDVETTFNEKRFYLSEREEELFNRIATKFNVAAEMREMGIRYVNSVLLYGESGTGKTLFGKYVAYKLKKPFYYLNFSHLLSSYLGETSKNIHKIFDYVKGQECVLMLDEIDGIGVRRGESNDVGEMNRIVIGLMQELDMLSNDVVLMAATNREDILDDALRRRFTQKHWVRRFNEAEMKSMINNLLIDIGMSADLEELDKYIREEIDGKTQGVVMNDVINRIARAVENKDANIKFTNS